MLKTPWNKIWTSKTIKESALSVDNYTDWMKTEKGAVGAAYRLGIYEDATQHFRKKTKWTYESLKASARKYKTKSDWRKHDGSAYVTAKKQGLIDELCMHMVTLRRNPYKRAKGPPDQV